MKCIKCNRIKQTSQVGPFPGPLCNSCFVKLIEKRVRKDVRVHKRLKPNSKIRVIDDGSQTAAVTIFLTKRIANEIRSEVIVDFDAECDILVIPWNLDQEVEMQLQKMFAKNPKECKKKEVKLLKTVSKEEILHFAKLKGFEGKKTKSYNKEIAELLLDLEKDHPEIKYSLLKSFEKLGLSL
ncbi:MAG: hypothetical protein MAG795_00470 [Candidatus Woesearchaeota archaeon]|nr:hypothetical protein [Candidatus Woesearchaeota archaeon]